MNRLIRLILLYSSQKVKDKGVKMRSMKRNLDIVRDVLLQVEKADGYLTINDLFVARDNQKGCNYTDNEIVYHVELLFAHGFLDGNIRRDMNGDITDNSIDGLTWDGADYLESMRDQRVWFKARDAIKRSVGSTTFDVVKQTCTLIATQLIKSNIGV